MGWLRNFLGIFSSQETKRNRERNEALIRLLEKDGKSSNISRFVSFKLKELQDRHGKSSNGWYVETATLRVQEGLVVLHFLLRNVNCSIEHTKTWDTGTARRWKKPFHEVIGTELKELFFID